MVTSKDQIKCPKCGKFYSWRGGITQHLQFTHNFFERIKEVDKQIKAYREKYYSRTEKIKSKKLLNFL